MFEIFAIFKDIPLKSLFTHLCPLAQSGCNWAGRKTEWNWNAFSDISSYWPQDLKKQLCAIWIAKIGVFLMKHPKVHCGCPGGFRVQRKAEGNSQHQLFNCRGSDMVWFFRKIRTSVQFIPFLQFHFFNEICFWSLIQILLTGRAQSQSVECTWGKYNSFVF